MGVDGRRWKKKGDGEAKSPNKRKIGIKGLVLIGIVVLSGLIVTVSATTSPLEDDSGTEFTGTQNTGDGVSDGDALIMQTSTYTENGGLDPRLTSQSEYGIVYTIIRSVMIIALMMLLLHFMKVQYRRLVNL